MSYAEKFLIMGVVFLFLTVFAGYAAKDLGDYAWRCARCGETDRAVESWNRRFVALLICIVAGVGAITTLSRALASP